MLRRLALVSVLGAACGSRPTGQMGLDVDITWEPDVTARCFKLRLDAEGLASVESNAMPRGIKKTLHVGVLRAELPETVQLQAIGYSDVKCETEALPLEQSPSTNVSFATGVSKISLRVARAATFDGGTDGGEDAGPPDAGPPDAGPPDAGPPDAGPPDAGPPDAGPPDAGPPDAGPPDAGPPDAGPPDAGPPELCANRVDDDGDTLIDCADPDCPANTPCSDANLCTSTDRCTAARTCVGQALMCMGPVPVCQVPSGCDAGMCTTTPAQARTFCDGGQCNGAGRCAPFCDPLAPTLAGCWQFENDLVDGTGHGANGTAVGGRFRAGSRGQAYETIDGGVIVGDNTHLDCTGPITLEAWVRLTAWPADGGRFGVLDNNGQYGVFIGPGGALRCSTGVGAPQVGVISLATWHHLGCIFDRVTVRSFIDGVELQNFDAGTMADGGIWELNVGDDGGLHLGQNSPSGDVLEGAIDGIRIWCEARSPLDLCAVPGECG